MRKLKLLQVACLVEIDCSGRRKKGTEFAHLPLLAGMNIWVTDKEEKVARLRYFIKKQYCLFKTKLLIS